MYINKLILSRISSNTLISFMVIVLLSACSSAPTVHTVSHLNKNIPPSKYNELLDKDFEKCKTEAYAKVPMPVITKGNSYPSVQTKTPSTYGVYNNYGSKIGELRPENSYNSAPDLGSIAQGYALASESPSRVYNSSIKRFIMACVKSKGWIIKKKN